MLRRLALASFALATAFVAACGHDVTPEPSLLNSNLSGKMVIRFRTTGPLNFSSFKYGIVIDACGLGVPLPNVYGTSFLNYSFGFFAGAEFQTAGPQLVEYYVNPGGGGGLGHIGIPLPPALTSFNPNDDGTGDEFELIFSRALLDHPFPTIAQPCPNITPTPAGTQVAAGTTPAPQPTTSAQATWIFNFFTIDASNRVVDSLGPGGPADTGFPGVDINVNQLVQMPVSKAAGGVGCSDPSGAGCLAGGEIDNYP